MKASSSRPRILPDILKEKKKEEEGRRRIAKDNIHTYNKEGKRKEGVIES